MQITKNDLHTMLTSACELLGANIGRLSDIDSKFGDGDHGVTIGKITRNITAKLPLLETMSIKAFLELLGEDTENIGGGSAGPLWGALLTGLSEGITEETATISEGDFCAMCSACLENMQLISTAKVGDKTMMDTLIPAVEAVKASGEPLPKLVRIFADAGNQGAKDSENYISKFGRARFYKEQTLGYQDAGATSLSLLFEGFAKGLGV